MRMACAPESSLCLLCCSEYLGRRRRAHFLARHFFDMLLELARNLVGEQIDNRIEVGVFFLRSRRDSSRFENGLATLPILVDLENQMHFPRPLQYAAKMSEF